MGARSTLRFLCGAGDLRRRLWKARPEVISSLLLALLVIGGTAIIARRLKAAKVRSDKERVARSTRRQTQIDLVHRALESRREHAG
jgi:hypothetical protein